jgi:hypothetical protein
VTTARDQRAPLALISRENSISKGAPKVTTARDQRAPLALISERIQYQDTERLSPGRPPSLRSSFCTVRDVSRRHR